MFVFGLLINDVPAPFGCVGFGENLGYAVYVQIKDVNETVSASLQISSCAALPINFTCWTTAA